MTGATRKYRANGAPPVPVGGVARQVRLDQLTHKLKTGKPLEDSEFKDHLLAILLHDRERTARCLELGLTAGAFAWRKGEHKNRGRQIVAEVAIEYFEKYHQPIGDLLVSQVQSYVGKIGLGQGSFSQLAGYLDYIQKLKPQSPDLLINTVREYLFSQASSEQLIRLSDLRAAGRLTPALVMAAAQELQKFEVEEQSSPADAVQWPEPLGPDAYYGLAGEVVRAIEPDTESDPAAILVQFLAAFGNVIGRHAYWRVEATRHYLNLFLAVVD